MLDFIRRWMLVIGMLSGAGLYVLYRVMPVLHPLGEILVKSCTIIQPVLLFLMLFLTFSKIEPKDLKPHRWQWLLLLVQSLGFLVPAVILILFPEAPLRIALEALMLCFITPTATACCVVTEKLGGDAAGVLTYTILVNLLTAILVPLVIPLVHPSAGIDFVTACSSILAKIFPLLILPCLCAWLVRYLCPKLHRSIKRRASLSFYIWALSLTLAILMSARALYHNDGSGIVVFELASATLLSCIIQFRSGKMIGAYYDRRSSRGGKVREITAGQSLGQKNTVFGIWMGYSFLTPVMALCGGFYSIFHNCYNTWQLRKLGDS